MDVSVLLDILFFVFFKQKTAYEMRISDWSSDVCSSDLLALDLVQVRTRMNGDPFAERARGILVRVVRHDHDARRAFCRDLRGNAIDRQLAIHRLSTSHGHGVVEQELVRDVDAGSARSADGQGARMEIGAVTEILKEVIARRIARQTDPEIGRAHV